VRDKLMPKPAKKEEAAKEEATADANGELL
jgi:recombination protein RecA